MRSPRMLLGSPSHMDETTRSGAHAPSAHPCAIARWFQRPSRLALLALALSAMGSCRDTRDPLNPARDAVPREGAHLNVSPSGCGRLLPGESLGRDQSVTSCNAAATLVLQSDQNVVLYDPAGAAWVAANTGNQGTTGLHMQTDGNLVAYDGAGRALWNSGTQGSTAWLAIQNDCNLVIYRGPFPEAGGVLWASNTSCRAPRPSNGRMLPGEQLWRGVSVTSLSGNATLAVQADQNVVLYGPQGPLWSAPNTLNRGTNFLAMQPDGNLVAYDVARQPLWSSSTQGSTAWLAIQDDCNLVVYRGPYPEAGGVLWASNTSCGTVTSVPVAPVAGPFRVTKLENPNCNNAPLPTWTFCQHQTDFHGDKPGVGSANDRYAWDINLMGGADTGLPVYAAAPGRVVSYGGSTPPGGASGAVLIQHNTNGRIWWTGYLHLAGIRVNLNDEVTAATIIGYVGSTGATTPHLHFAVYSGSNTYRGLQSHDAQLVERK